MKDRIQNAWVNLVSHPIAWPLLRLSGLTGPVIRLPGIGILINDAELANEILCRDRDFIKNGPGSFSETVTRVLGPLALINMDGPDHQKLRALLSPALSSFNADTLLETCQQPLAGLAEDLSQGRVVDFARFMRGLSARVSIELIGAEPVNDLTAQSLVRTGIRIAQILERRQPSPTEFRMARADCDRLKRHIRRQRDPGSSSSPKTIASRLREGFSVSESESIMSVFFMAGSLTSASALPRIAALLIDSGQIEFLRKKSVSTSNAVHEGLRFTAPVPLTMRFAQRDVQIGARRFPQGSRVLIATLNTTRDRQQFEHPNRFDIQRPLERGVQHFWFGAGPHFCMGFRLAQKLLEHTLKMLCEAPAPVRIVSRRAARHVLLPGYERLNIRCDLA